MINVYIIQKTNNIVVMNTYINLFMCTHTCNGLLTLFRNCNYIQDLCNYTNYVITSQEKNSTQSADMKTCFNIIKSTQSIND